ncbi:MAG TPA: hypothetical protein VD838_18060, partial [Anaeromyxobacteraceae bacterium]|nr:hypothetical protein [Anaeromyxobacteraceae bacterium]
MSTESGGLEALRPLCRVLLVGAALACSGAERDPAVTQGGGLVPVPTARGAAVSPTTYGIVTESGGTLVTPDGALQ